MLKKMHFKTILQKYKTLFQISPRAEYSFLEYFEYQSNENMAIYQPTRENLLN